MSEPGTGAEAGGHGPLVLVIEDDGGVRRLLEAVFTDAGFEVASARDGLEGLLKLRMLEPAAIVLDIMMPDIGGMRVLDELATDHAAIPVVVVTGKPEAADACRGRIGPENVFEKPFEVDAIVGRVRAVTGGPGEGDDGA